VNRAVTVTVARLSSVCSTRSEISTLLAELAEFQPRSQCTRVIAPALRNRFRLVHRDLVEIPADVGTDGQSSSVSEDRGRRPERAPARIAQPVPARQDRPTSPRKFQEIPTGYERGPDLGSVFLRVTVTVLVPFSSADLCAMRYDPVVRRILCLVSSVIQESRISAVLPAIV